MLTQIEQWIMHNKEHIHNTYQHLHQHAEISWEEIETTSYLADKLSELKLPYNTFTEHTGVVGLWKGSSDGPTIGIRADIDALWQNVKGEWRANHSCGHDAHATIVLYTLVCLKEIGFVPQGQLKVIFQPAEETGHGAKAMIKQGIVDDVDCLLGIHLRPIQEISYGQAAPAIYHSATALLKGQIKGLQAHAARPHLGINVIDSLAAITHAVNAIKLDPTISYSAKMTMVHTPGKNLNIIPDEAEFGIDVRASTNEALQTLLDKLSQTVQAAGSANGAEVTLEVAAMMGAAVPNQWMEEIVREAIIDVHGSAGYTPPIMTPGGEDFHFYAIERPHIQATMVGLGCDLAPGLHHPDMSFNQEALLNGIKIMALTIVKLFDAYNKSTFR